MNFHTLVSANVSGHLALTSAPHRQVGESGGPRGQDVSGAVKLPQIVGLT